MFHLPFEHLLKPRCHQADNMLFAVEGVRVLPNQSHVCDELIDSLVGGTRISLLGQRESLLDGAEVHRSLYDVWVMRDVEGDIVDGLVEGNGILLTFEGPNGAGGEFDLGRGERGHSVRD